MDRVDTGRYMLFVPRPADLNQMMVWDRAWFMIKNVKDGGARDTDMLAAWADMWVAKTHKQCCYDAAHMETLKTMEKRVYDEPSGGGATS